MENIVTTSEKYSNVKVSNIVVNGSINTELDLDALQTVDREEWDVYCRDGVPYTVEFTFKQLPMVSVYSSGSYIIRGSGKERIKEANKQFLVLFDELGIIKGVQDVEFTINNIVGTITLDESLNLERIANLGSSKQFQYEPSQFPAVTYRGAEFYSANIFNSGKIIIQGCKSEESLEKAAEDIQTIISKHTEQTFDTMF